MTGQIFISYRREESRGWARSLHDRLCRDFDPKQIFMDIDAIALGEDFVEVIESTVAKCDVLIAMIGNNWLTAKDAHGNRRLDNPEDLVRMEIGAALKRKIRVIPVLVDGALMPQSTDIPDDLKPLARRNALAVTDTGFDGDCQRLTTAIRQVLEKAAAEEQERLVTEQRQREEQERLVTEQRQHEEQERLVTEQRQREEQERLVSEPSGSKDNIAQPSQEQGTPQAQTPPIVQKKGLIKQKPSTRVVLIVSALFLIVGLIWFASSQLSHNVSLSGKARTLILTIHRGNSCDLSKGIEVPAGAAGDKDISWDGTGLSAGSTTGIYKGGLWESTTKSSVEQESYMDGKIRMGYNNLGESLDYENIYITQGEVYSYRLRDKNYGKFRVDDVHEGALTISYVNF